MKKQFEVIKKMVNYQIITSLRDNDDFLLDKVLKAYNCWNEDERDGVDYIFDIHKKEDLVACVNGGLTAKDIVFLYDNGTRFFLFGCNHTTPQGLNQNDLFNILYDNLDEVIDNIIAYPYVESYREIYTMFITDNLIKD